MAQNVIANDSITLQEVTVASNVRVEQNADGAIYIPNVLQKQHSANGAELLKAMNFPALNVDLLQKSISYPSGGAVQLRINNVLSSLSNLQSIDASLVKSIRFITMPGLKYGNDVGLVIDVRCKRADVGTSAALTTMNSLTTLYNDVGTWGKITTQNSEWGINYNFRQNSNSDVVTATTQSYADGSLPLNIRKDGKYNKSNFTSHNAVLSYNFVSPNAKHLFDIKLLGNFAGFPHRELSERTIADSVASVSVTNNKSNEAAPSLKLYYAYDIDSLRSVSAYWTGGFISNKYDRGFISDDVLSVYHVDGEKFTMHGELNFSQTLSTGRFDIGAHADASSTTNEYSNDASTSYSIHTDEQFLYAERLTKFSKVQMKIGIGGNRLHFSSDEAAYTFWSVEPYLTLRVALGNQLTMFYRFNRNSYSPSLADLTDYARRDDMYEITVGNSELKPYNDNQNELIFALDLGDTYFDLTANYNLATDAIYMREPIFDDLQNVYFISKANGATTHNLKLSLYAERYLVERKLFIYAMPTIARDIVDADEYVHTNTDISLKVGAQLYVKDFAVNAGYGTPTETLSSYALMHNFATSDVSVSYNKRRFSAKIGVRNLFAKDGTGMKVSRLSANAPKEFEQHNRAFGNMVYVGATWNIKQQKQQRRLKVVSTNANTDSGIVK